MVKKSNSNILSQIITVKSAQRNKLLYPNSYDYFFEFDQSMYGIHSIELLSAEIPNSDYVVHENNNKIDFQIEGDTTIYTAVLTVGDYDISTLTTHLNNVFNAIIAGWTISADELVTYKYTFTYTSKFRFLNKTGPNIAHSFGPIIGYRDIGIDSQDTDFEFSHIPPYTFSLSGDSGIILDVGDTSVNFYHTSDKEDPQYFARLPLKVDSGSWLFWSKSQEYDIKYEFNTRIHPILERLHIQFFKEGYRKQIPYNFRGEENILVFKIRGFFNKAYAEQNAEEFDQPSYETSLLKGVNEQSTLLLDIREELKKDTKTTVIDSIGNTITELTKTFTGKDTTNKLILDDELFQEVSEPEFESEISEDIEIIEHDSDSEPESDNEPEKEESVLSEKYEKYEPTINTIPSSVDEENIDKLWESIPVKFGILLGVVGIVLIIMINLKTKKKK